MVYLADSCGESADTDTVAAHNGMVEVALAVGVGHIHRLGVLGAELEDVTYLDTAGDGYGVLAAYRTNATLLNLSEIVELGVGNVPVHIETCVVIFLLVSAGNKVVHTLKGSVEENDSVSVEANRTDEACANSALKSNERGVDLKAKEVGELGFIYLKVTAKEENNILIVRVSLVYNSLAGVLSLGLEEGANLLDGVRAGCVYLGEFLRGSGAGVLGDILSSFHIGSVVTLGTDNDGVFADIGKEHKFVRNAAAHHTGVGLYGYNFGDARSCKYALICLVALIVILNEIIL